MKRFFRWFMGILKIKHEHCQDGYRGYVPIPRHANFGIMTFQIHGLDNFNEKEKKKFMVAIELGMKVLNSVEFKNLVSQSKYVENKALTGLQIWETICTGKDLYNPESDYDIDVFVTMYNNFWTGTIGYTFPNTFKTWINRKFFQDFNEAKILGNVIHEAMHNFGFKHKDMTKRYDSVPYKVGYFARGLAQQIMGGQKLTPLKVV